MLALAVSDAETTTPGDAQLQRLIDTYPQRYSAEPALDFEQLYLGANSAGTRAMARTLIAQLRAGKPAGTPLPPAPIDRHFTIIAPGEIAELFGGSFADSIRDLRTGEWQGPVASGLGLHLVKVDSMREPKPPRLAEIRQRVENDWRSAAIERAEDASYREMAARYDVVIEPRK